jgi:hypothetical protein
MNKYIIIFLLLILTGCGDILNNWELVKAYDLCKDKDGLDYIIVNDLLGSTVRCMDGNPFLIKAGKYE